jgi:FMN phosphatase YigB (HAD superfamily)
VLRYFCFIKLSTKEEGELIKAVVFDLDNTLVDFMKLKRLAIEEAIPAMIDAGLEKKPEYANKLINEIYKEQGIKYQQVFYEFLKRVLHNVNYQILAAGIVAYRPAREAALKPYPHVYSTLNKLLKMGVLSDAPIKEAWLRLAYLNLHHIFDALVTFDETGE